MGVMLTFELLARPPETLSNEELVEALIHAYCREEFAQSSAEGKEWKKKYSGYHRECMQRLDKARDL